MRNRIINVFAVSLVVLVACTGVLGAEDTDDLADARDFMKDFLPGRYVLIGKAADSDVTYAGTLVIEKDKAGGFRVKRITGKVMIPAHGAIEKATADNVPVFRIRFIQSGRSYEATYVIGSDLDNYPRLTGYLYPVSHRGGPPASMKEPGLEACFYKRK